MIKLNVSLAERSYPIYITTNFDSLGECLINARIGDKLAIIADTNVDALYTDECMRVLRGTGFDVSGYVIGAGEKIKNLETVAGIYKFLIEGRFDRNATIIALGGGVTGDIAGFASATYLRGINFVQVPTSLLAQVDSSVGGKVGVDFDGNKNMIGAFYQPRLVYINVNTLKTLPERELNSGMAEVIKHSLIKDAEFFDYLEYNIKKVHSFDEDALLYIAKVNCSIKSYVVEHDERESGLRAILNFGHTFGHALESASDFSLLHGECVSAGIFAAYKMAEKLGMVDNRTAAKVAGLLRKAGLPVKIEGFDVEKVYGHMFHDKKIKNNRLVFILPKGIGDVVEISIEDQELIKSTLREILV